MGIEVSDFVASFIATLGVKEVFLVSGGPNLQLVDAIARNEKLKYVCNHHEQSSAIAAECYSRVSDNIGVCVVTVGPGVTNAITGIASAWLDSIPVLYISGQVKRDNMVGASGLRQLGVQEVNAVELVKSITKHALVVMDPIQIKYELQKAVYIAKSGRPGPVLIDIPSDVQSAIVDEEAMPNFEPEINKVGNDQPLKSKVAELIKMIKEAKRPIIFSGHGIRLAKGKEKLLELVEKSNLPIVTSMSSHDLVPTNHKLYVGRPGVFGDRAGNFAIQNCDLLLSIGVRHHLWNIGYNYNAFAKFAKKAIVDIDILELNKKTVHADLPIQADARDFLIELVNQIEKIDLPDISNWRDKCRNWKNKYPVVLPEYKNEKDYVNSYYFTEILSSQLKEKEIIVTGVGTAFTGTLQCFKVKNDQRLISNVGCAAMGYDLPAAIGACFANNKKRVILISGDGGIMMNIQELQVIKHYNLPIKIFLLNNSGYLAIKNSQNSFFNGRLVAVDKTSGVSFPDFKKIAFAFDIAYRKMHDHTGIKEIIAEVLKTDGPIICDINMSPKQALIPKVYSIKNPDGTMESKPLEDMYPFLEREELASNMPIDNIFFNS